MSFRPLLPRFQLSGFHTYLNDLCQLATVSALISVFHIPVRTLCGSQSEQSTRYRVLITLEKRDCYMYESEQRQTRYYKAEPKHWLFPPG